ncbi:MAG: biotin/lipoyl-containing protein, partial [Actinomycetes bacterium]
QGPGVRWDSGVETGGEVAGAFDSMLAKLIVTGATREEALQRARRALDELVVEGMPTVIPFHRAVVRDEAFTSEPFTVHTRWIETEWDHQVQPYDAAPAERDVDAPRQTVVVEVGGRRLEVSLPAGLAAGSSAPGAAAKPRRRGGAGSGAGASGDDLTSPMQGTIVKVAVEDGATVEAGDLVVVLEAMKMEQPITAHKAGTVSGMTAEVGASVTSGAVLCTIAD